MIAKSGRTETARLERCLGRCIISTRWHHATGWHVQSSDMGARRNVACRGRSEPRAARPEKPAVDVTDARISAGTLESARTARIAALLYEVLQPSLQLAS